MPFHANHIGKNVKKSNITKRKKDTEQQESHKPLWGGITRHILKSNLARSGKNEILIYGVSVLLLGLYVPKIILYHTEMLILATFYCGSKKFEITQVFINRIFDKYFFVH